MPYQHLAQDERYQIAALFRTGLTRIAIAAELGRSPSTITREFRAAHPGLDEGYIEMYCESGKRRMEMAAIPRN